MRKQKGGTEIQSESGYVSIYASQSVGRSVVSPRIHTKSGYECKIKSGEHGNKGEGKTEYAEAERSLQESL